jgi:hypothetical protein
MSEAASPPRESPTEAEVRAEARREAAPVAFASLVVFVALAVVSRAMEWELVGFPWWIWLVTAAPSLLLTIDLVMARSGTGLVRTRRAAVALLAALVLGNLLAIGLLVAGLVRTSASELDGGELLLTGFAIWTADVIVFGLLFWEVDAGGPAARVALPARATPDFQFPQDENPQLAPSGWRPVVWDYLYLSLTNSIAFSPTDAMPLSLRAKAAMGLEAGISAVTILLVAARAVNVLGE